MAFHKFHNAANFEFISSIGPRGQFCTARGRYRFLLDRGLNDTHFIGVRGPAWQTRDSQADLHFSPAARNGVGSSILLAKDGQFSLRSASGENLLSSAPGRFFGQCGEASLFEFQREEGDRFYGLGEKWLSLEHTGRTTKFWNTNVWADFHPESVIHGVRPPDPAYVSIPYLIVRRRSWYIGLLLDNPYLTFVSTGQLVSIAGQLELGETKAKIYLGAEQGAPGLYLILGSSLGDLTRKFQRLVGTTPRPPVWALGYHQCRWGYRSYEDLRWLDEQFRHHRIPADGLWLDIDYMDRYRVFSYDCTAWPKPRRELADLHCRGRKVVPIFDPGIKQEESYPIFRSARKAGVLCRNPQGQDYVGIAWPGETVFPDYSIPAGRRWWAQEVEKMAQDGLFGAWLDMNDPATGPVAYEDMLFDHGRKSHGFYHNQYATGMAEATFAGFRLAHPDQRPFLLSRSASTGAQRFAAIWTGDNYSNYVHLRASLPTSLNLALSGIPFNGPDIGGFGGDTTPELLCDWMKACFLFPFCRNHTFRDSRRQEPWAFGRKVLGILRHHIQLRYRLRPYLYQLFITHERMGEAILRPLLYDFDAATRLTIDRVDDQFLIGPHVMQAPFLQQGQREREVLLPGAQAWYDVAASRWLKGEQIIKVVAQAKTTPLYIRDGAILPLARSAPGDNTFAAGQVDFWFFFSRDQQARTIYVIDDGESYGYQRGEESDVELSAKLQGDTLVVVSNGTDKGVPPAFTFTTPRGVRSVRWNDRPLRPVSRQGLPLGLGWRSWAL